MPADPLPIVHVDISPDGKERVPCDGLSYCYRGQPGWAVEPLPEEPDIATMPADPREVVVRGCHDECPFRENEWNECVHPDVKPPNGNAWCGLEVPLPEWCPLRERPTLVRLEVRDG